MNNSNRNYFKSANGIGLFYILGVTILLDGLIFLLLQISNTYELNYLLKVSLIAFNIYQGYFILMYITLKYSIEEDGILIIGIWGLRRVKIPFASIEKYNKVNGAINGVRIFGYGNDFFAMGKFIIQKIGTTYMYVTTNKEVFYFKTEHVNYALSPVDTEKFNLGISQKGIEFSDWEYIVNDESALREEKKFTFLLVVSSVIIIILTLTPLVLYIKNKLPVQMPLKFDGYFVALKFGTSKQFVFKQMIYGVLNMAILFCMYYASHFSAKYDKKSAYYFMYLSLIVALAFLIMQFRILLVFR